MRQHTQGGGRARTSDAHTRCVLLSHLAIDLSDLWLTASCYANTSLAPSQKDPMTQEEIEELVLSLNKIEVRTTVF